MNHLARLLAILTILKSKRIITGTELAKKFKVSLRTIYRDMRKLEESGVPVITLEGRGYTILEGYFVPPVMFEEHEANALITAEQLIAKTNDNSLIDNFNRAVTKIKSVFKSSLQSQSELLLSKMLILNTGNSEIKTNSLSALQMAIINFKVTEIAYEAKSGNSSFRKIEPSAIYCYKEQWIIIAWCHLRQDFRAFRLDRIKHFKILDEKFEDRKFDIRSYFLSCPKINYHP